MVVDGAGEKLTCDPDAPVTARRAPVGAIGVEAMDFCRFKLSLSNDQVRNSYSVIGSSAATSLKRKGNGNGLLHSYYFVHVELV